MATKRLIDANALLEKIQFRIEPYGVVGATIKDCVEKTREIIMAEPAVDAVEVVRCKDCINAEYFNGVLVCGVANDVVRQKNDFCSYGERKDND